MLLHEPYGQEHPYEQGLTERRPRDPIAGQPVALGVATSPAGAVESVWAAWQREGEKETHRAEGKWLRDDRGLCYWQAVLPAFEGGQRITYRLHARRGDALLRSEIFAFVVAGWRPVGEVRGYRLTGSGLELECGPGDAAPVSRLALAFPAPHRLHVRLAAPLPGSGRKNGSPVSTTPCRIVTETANCLVVAAKGWLVTVHRDPCRLVLSTAEGKPLLQETGPLSWLVGQGGRPLRVRQTFAAPSQEAFFGFGERFNALNQRGNTLDVRVFEQYKNQGRRTYLPIPFMLSSRGYGLYLATSRHVAYDLAAAQKDRWSFEAELGPQDDLEYHLIAGCPQEILATLADLTGRPVLPPRWAFGPWMSSNEWNNQSLVMEQVRQTVEHRIPATVLVIEAWSDESTFYIWNDAQYTPKPAGEPFSYDDFDFPAGGRWPDPRGMVEALNRLGIRVLLWQVPVMKKLAEPHPQHDRDERYMIERGYCVREAGGQPYRIRPFWFHDGLLLDVTHPEAVRWWLGKRAYLLDELGISGFKTDGGEHLWGRDLRFADGRRGDELGNLYPNLYAGAYHRFACEKRRGDAVTFSRAGFTGAQAYPCHWAGDENSTWEAFCASLRAGLNAGISGVPFWGWDLAGFSGEIPSAELYLRSAAMAAFCPIMQYHSEFNAGRWPSRDRTPWNIARRTGNPDVIPAYCFYANLRLNLLPYIYSEAQHSSQTGLPLMRTLWLDYPQDATCWELQDQYLFGRTLLVAPVLEEGARRRQVYLPRGRWFDLWRQRVHEGPCWLDCEAPPEVIPVFVRGGSVLPLHTGKSYELGSPFENTLDRYERLVFQLYPAATATTDRWYDGPSARPYTFTLEPRPGGGLKVGVPPIPYACTLRVSDAGFRQVICDGRSLCRAERLATLNDDTWYGERDGWAYARLPAARVSRELLFSLSDARSASGLL